MAPADESHLEKSHGGEVQEVPPMLEKDIPFEQGKPWQTSLRTLLQESLSEKYRQDLDEMVDYVEGKQEFFSSMLKDMAFIAIKDNVLIFKNKDGKEIRSIDLQPILNRLARERYRRECELCHSRARRLRIYEYRGTPYGGLLNQIALRSRSKRPKQEEKKVVTGHDAVLSPELLPDPQELQRNERESRLLRDEKASRGATLRMILASPEGNFDIFAHVSPTIQDDTAEEFREHWRFMDFSREIEDLFSKEPDRRAGYAFNPFREMGWHQDLDRLRDLFQQGKNDRLYFKEVAEVIYNARFDNIKENLKQKGFPKVLLEMIDTDLQTAYQKIKKLADELGAFKDERDLKKIPEHLKPFWAHRDKVGILEQMLGDYLVYARKLTNYVHELRYNEAKPTEDRERDMFEFEEETSDTARERNRVKGALHQVFRSGVDTPREYESELSHIFSSSETKRPITFEDLNGKVATATDEWFTGYLTPDAAYHLAYIQIEEQKKEDGRDVSVLTEVNAQKHLNDLLQLGLAAFESLPKNQSLQDVINELNEEGVEVYPGFALRFTGTGSDMRNLYQALSIKNLSDLSKNETTQEKLMNAKRKLFIRIGSVVYEKNKFQRQERLRGLQEKEARKKIKAVLRPSPAQTEAFIQQLKKRVPDHFTDAQLAKITSVLVGGGLVVVPDQGGGIAFNIPFDDGFSIQLSTVFPHWESFAAGLGIGKQFEVTSDVTVSLHAGGGTAFASPGGAAGIGGSVTYNLSGWKFSLEAGAGAVSGPVGPMPTLFAGLGVDWGRFQEQYREKLSKKIVQHHIEELDKSSDPYKLVKENPAKYRELAQILDRMDQLGLRLDEEMRRDIFNGMYGLFKEGLQQSAIDESSPEWYKRLLPTGVGIGAATVGNVPFLYAYFQFHLPWSRTLIYHLASDVKQTEAFTEAQANAAILKAYRENKNVTIAQKIIKTSGELVRDPRTGELALRTTGKGVLDFKQYDRFEEFREELVKNSNIFVEPASVEGKNMGLLLLKPQEAYGNTRVFVDPALGDAVMVVTMGEKLYLSVKRDTELSLQRTDLHYPASRRGALQDTVITISNNLHFTPNLIQDESFVYMEKLPHRDWVKRQHRLPETPEQLDQVNVSTLEDYRALWDGGNLDRLEFSTMEGIHEAYDLLSHAVRVQADELPHFEVSADLRNIVAKLVHDEDFMTEIYRKFSTIGYDFQRSEGTKIEAKWNENYQELARKIQEKVGRDITADEFNFITMALMIESFLNIQKEGQEKAKKLYEHFLNHFEKPMLESILSQYYAGQENAEQKKNTAVEWIMSQLKQIDITNTPQEIAAGTAFASLVGTVKITGMRRMYNFRKVNPEDGVVGETQLALKAKDTSGEVARFWLGILSPYNTSLSRNLSKNSFDQDKIYENLRSPLALKLAPLIAVVFTPDEMKALSGLYGDHTHARRLVDKDNIEAVKKFFQWCDKVREAELAGKTEIELEHGFTLFLNTKVSMGVFKVCGNYSGLLREDFALVHKGQKKIYFASQATGFIDIQARYERVDFPFKVGVALPIPSAEAVGEKPPESTPRPTPRLTPTNEPIPLPHVAEIPPPATPQAAQPRVLPTQPGGGTGSTTGPQTASDVSGARGASE